MGNAFSFSFQIISSVPFTALHHMCKKLCLALFLNGKIVLNVQVPYTAKQCLSIMGIVCVWRVCVCVWVQFSGF